MFVSRRAYGSPDFKQLAPSTLRSYVSAIKSTNIDLGYSTGGIADRHIDRLIKGAANLFPSARRPQRKPLTHDILLNILSPVATHSEHIIDTLNLNAAFTAAYSGFLRMGEITYTLRQASNNREFKATRPTRGSIVFKSDHVRLFLPRSKTDKKNQGVNIPMAKSNEDTCPYFHMKQLFYHDPQGDDQPLFRLHSGPFDKKKVLRLLAARLNRVYGENSSGRPSSDGYSGHSIRRGAAQDAHDKGASNEEIMVLGRWRSDAIKLYFTVNPKNILRIQHSLQTTSAKSNPTTPVGAGSLAGPTGGSP